MGTLLGNVWGKLKKEKVYFNRFVCIDPFWQRYPISSDKNVLCVVQSALISRDNFNLVLGTKREVREPFLHLWSLQCPQLKIINMPKQCLLGDMF